jgi:hypothetical protein
MIRRRGRKYCVVSPRNPDWSGGCYDTRREAEARLRQVESIKHAKGMGQRPRICWEVDETGMTWHAARQASEQIRGSVRLTYDDEDRSWTLERQVPCGQPHWTERFRYRGMGDRRRRRRR